VIGEQAVKLICRAQYLEGAAATNWHFGLHLVRPRNKNADVYNSLADGTVHRSCRINTLVMYYCFSYRADLLSYEKMM